MSPLNDAEVASAIGAKLLDRIDELVAEALDPAVRVPGYERFSEEDLRAIKVEGIEHIIALAFSGQSDLSERYRSLADIALQHRLSLGLTPAEILNALSQSFEIVWRAALVHARAMAIDSDAVAALNDRLMEFHRQIMDDMTSSVRAARLDLLRLAESEQRELLQVLFSGRALPRRAAFSIPLDGSVPFKASGPDVALDSLAEAERNSGRALLLGRVGHDLIGVGRDRPAPTPGVVVGVGPGAAVADLPTSCRVAVRAHEAARLLDRVGVFGLEDLGVHRLVVEEPDMGDELARRYLGPLLDHRGLGAGLIDTVVAWFECGMNIEATAQALNLHTNTLRYRLRRVEDLTGARLDMIDDLVGLWWAVQRRRVTDSGHAG